MRYLDEFSDNPAAASRLSERIHALLKDLADGGETRIMEICGTHTMAIARHGIRGMIPSGARLISGPGCPVCVTAPGYVDAARAIAEQGALIATFGDMMRVPGSEGALSDCRAEGGDIEVCYSPMGALDLARNNPGREVVFLGVGFETTTAAIAVAMKAAAELDNLSFLLALKTVPPAIRALLDDPEIRIDAMLCPAHVSAIIGSDAYRPFVGADGVPCVIAGFEALDLLMGIAAILEQIRDGRRAVENCYRRVVRASGNQKALALMRESLVPTDAAWRGIGVIPASGLSLRPEFERLDAAKRFGVDPSGGTVDPRCLCGDVLKGKIVPPECPMFGRACVPSHPIGPCMVSSEGSCAAYYKYGSTG